MSATATKPTAGRVSSRDLAAVLKLASAARADEVELRPDCTLRFLGGGGDVAAHVPFPGEAWPGEARWVDRATLARVARSCGGNMTIESIDSGLRVVSGSVNVTLPERPRPRTYLDVNADASRCDLFTMDATTLAHLLSTAAPFATRDETRPVISAVALDMGRGKVVSTDSYRLALLDAPAIKVEDGGTVIVALGGVKLLATQLARANGEITVREGEKDVAFAFSGQTWALSKREGTYPNWRELLPDSDEIAVFEVEARDVLKASSLISDVSERNAPMTISIQGDSVVAASRGHRGSTRAEVVLDVNVTVAPRDQTTVGVDPGYLREIASVIAPARVVVGVIAPLRPVALSAPGMEFLLMPIRLMA